MLVTFSGRCSAMLYRWSKTETKFLRETRVKTGPVDVWTVLPADKGMYLVVSGPRACQVRHIIYLFKACRVWNFAVSSHGLFCLIFSEFFKCHTDWVYDVMNRES